MAEVISLGGGNHHIVVYQDATVIAGDGSDSIELYKLGKVIAGDGNDSVAIHGLGNIAVGSGNDTLNLYTGGVINQTGSSGHDTINIGHGFDTIVEQGQATVQGSTTYGGYPSTFGSATIDGGTLEIGRTHATLFGPEIAVDIAVSGNVTLLGSAASTEFVGGTGSSDFIGGSGASTFVGGSGFDTLTGGTGSNVFEFLHSEAGGQHVITNFVAGDKLYIEAPGCTQRPDDEEYYGTQ
jgi:Ca2+-binding RTX toxin-like protein